MRSLLLATLATIGCAASGSNDHQFLSAADSKSDGNDSGTYVRFAHLANAPAGDACVAPHGTTSFIGPVLRLFGHPAISSGQVTEYFAAPAGTWDLRLVLGDAADCSVGVLPDITDLPALADGVRMTVALVGELGDQTSPLAVRAFADQHAPDGTSAVRFVHAAIDAPALDLRASVGGSAFVTVFSNVSFGQADASGYFMTSPAHAAVAIRASSGGADLLTLPDVELPAGKALTAFALNVASSLQLLSCEDTNVGVPAACQTLH